jgi:acyl-coenzyme A synthetase/AMP-(fatty) acid ligase
MSWPPLPRAVSAAFAAPYRSAARREAVGTFVADIPLESDHPSARSLDAIADGIRDLDGTPVLLLWGPGDPVFSDRYLTDLLDRVPHADVHRYEGARHLVMEDDPAVVVDLLSWIDDLLIAQASHDPGAKAASQQPTLAADDRRLMGSALDRRRQVDPAGTALTEWRGGDGWRRVSWEHLAMTVDQLAGGLATRGIQCGDRVALLIRPGADLIAVIYACWRIGASVVVTDAGLGARGIHRALRGSGARHVIGIPAGIALVRATGVPGQRISTSELVTIAQAGRFATLPPPPGQEVEALVAFTSGSTGPAKGVVYRHRQVEETRDLLQSHYAITDADVLVAAFAPWAVLGPALGIACVLPDMDVTSPRTLSAAALADAVEVSRGTLLWASPAALTSVLEGSADLTVHQREAFGSLRLVLAAGAPVQVDLLRAMADLCPNAQARTPYGMTEALPVCDVTLEEIEAAGLGDGVVVGRPLPGVDVRVSALADDGRAVGPLSDEPGVLGEIVVRGAHIRDHYDRLWSTQRSSARDAGWHRTGDVGHLDEAGRLWIGGRLAHVVTTPEGPLAPVGVEQRVLGLDGVRAAACVGVGPVGTQQIVVVVVTDAYRTGLADLELTDRIRAVSGYPVAAVLEHRELPVDIRHNSKIDRTALAAWAGGRLAGRGKP